MYFLHKKIEEYKEQLKDYNYIILNKISRYEKKWRYIKRKYEQVYVYGIEFISIGETIPRLFMFLSDIKKKNGNTYNIVFPIFSQYYKGGIFNNGIFDIFRGYLHFITKDNIDFWQYVFTVHLNKVNITQFNKYRYRNATLVYVEEGHPVIPFSKELVEYAEDSMKFMGIKGEYVCLHAREVKNKMRKFTNYSSTMVADVDINSFKQAVGYMQDLGYQAVRMGKYESKECEIKNIIDYSNYYYNGLMDFYLIANCKFLIGSLSGLTGITAFWGRPVLITNVGTFCYGYESLATTKYDLYIPKKFYSKKKNRLLNLMEILNVSNKLDRYDERFVKAGIEWIDNTKEEILKATMEMNNKMDHTWIYTEEETECMKRYWNIINLWRDRHKTSFARKRSGAEGYIMFPISICYSYLKDNMYLLDIQEV